MVGRVSSRVCTWTPSSLFSSSLLYFGYFSLLYSPLVISSLCTLLSSADILSASLIFFSLLYTSPLCWSHLLFSLLYTLLYFVLNTSLPLCTVLFFLLYSCLLRSCHHQYFRILFHQNCISPYAGQPIKANQPHNQSTELVTAAYQQL